MKFQILSAEPVKLKTEIQINEELHRISEKINAHTYTSVESVEHLRELIIRRKSLLWVLHDTKKAEPKTVDIGKVV
jgi:hypothetical protein